MQTWFFNLGKATSLRKRKQNSNPLNCLKVDLGSHPARVERLGKYINEKLSLWFKGYVKSSLGLENPVQKFSALSLFTLIKNKLYIYIYIPLNYPVSVQGQ